MISLGPFYMGWAFLACNSVQHLGLHHGTDDNHVPDFRLTTRTMYINDPKRSILNPISWPFRVVRFWSVLSAYSVPASAAKCALPVDTTFAQVLQHELPHRTPHVRKGAVLQP